MLKEPSGFTDDKLKALVSMNVFIGNEILRALVAVHQGQTSPSKALQGFSYSFNGFMQRLSSAVINDLYIARVGRPLPENGRLVSFRMVRNDVDSESDGTAKPSCPECKKDLDYEIAELDQGDYVDCYECGAAYKVVGLKPLKLSHVDDEGEPLELSPVCNEPRTS